MDYFIHYVHPGCYVMPWVSYKWWFFHVIIVVPIIDSVIVIAGSDDRKLFLRYDNYNVYDI